MSSVSYQTTSDNQYYNYQLTSLIRPAAAAAAADAACTSIQINRSCGRHIYIKMTVESFPFYLRSVSGIYSWDKDMLLL